MGSRKGPHHRGQHQRLAKLVTDAAYANPNTVCQAATCRGWGNRTLAEHPNAKTGRPPIWTAGHRVAGRIATSVRDYRPEVDVCGSPDGTRHGNRNREPHTEIWW